MMKKERPKVLWLCKTAKEVKELEDAVFKNRVEDLAIVQPDAPKKKRDEIAFIFETKNDVEYLFHNLGDPLDIAKTVKEIDAVYYPFFFQKIHITKPKGEQMRAISDELTKQGKPAFMQVCDFKFNTVVEYLERNPDTTPRARKTIPTGFFNPKQRLVYQVSYKEGKGSKEVYEKHFGPRAWRKKNEDRAAPVELTRDIEFVESEWIALDWPLVKEEARLWAERQNESKPLFEVDKDSIESFYYGIDRPGIVDSLRSLGFGDSPDDAHTGTIYRLFPKVRSLGTDWRSALPRAKKLLFPFEKHKSEWQITARIMEYIVYSGSETEVIVDEKVSSFIREIVEDTSGSKMDEEFERVRKEMPKFWNILFRREI